MDRQGRQAIGT
jgi:hypothetical protein